MPYVLRAVADLQLASAAAGGGRRPCALHARRRGGPCIRAPRPGRRSAFRRQSAGAPCGGRRPRHHVHGPRQRQRRRVSRRRVRRQVLRTVAATPFANARPRPRFLVQRNGWNGVLPEQGGARPRRVAPFPPAPAAGSNEAAAAGPGIVPPPPPPPLPPAPTFRTPASRASAMRTASRLNSVAGRFPHACGRHFCRRVGDHSVRHLPTHQLVQSAEHRGRLRTTRGHSEGAAEMGGGSLFSPAAPAPAAAQSRLLPRPLLLRPPPPPLPPSPLPLKQPAPG